MSFVLRFGVEWLSYDITTVGSGLTFDSQRVLGEIVEPHFVIQIERPNLVLDAFVFEDD